MTLALLRQYLASVRRRRELAEIMRDEDAWQDARDAEADAEKAIDMVRSGEWFEPRDRDTTGGQCPPPVPTSYSDRGI